MTNELDFLRRIAENIIDVQDVDLARENANLNGESFSGKMSKLGSEFSKWYVKSIMPAEVVKHIDSNHVYVHDLDQYVLGTTNCIFIPFDKLLERGFNTGNGSVRPPNSIGTAMSLVAIIFQSQQNAQYGGVSANKLDWDLAPYVNKTFRKHFRKAVKFLQENAPYLSDEQITFSNKGLFDTCPESYAYAHALTVEDTNQAAEALVHNLNTMSSRAGGQIPFTSINYGTCTSDEGRLVIDAILNATIKGLGNGETPIFPIQIFKCKKGVNQSPEDVNYDLFLKSIECSSKRLYPNFANIDAPFNLAYYNPADHNTEFATMGCRTRVIGDRFGHNHLSGKGNLSFNTLNLVKVGIENGICLGDRVEPDVKGFYKDLEHYLEVALEGLLHRYKIQAAQKAKASDFMMREGVWENGETLAPDDKVEELIKHGSLSIGFIGLAECMKAMYGKHHAEDDEVYKEAIAVISFMREWCDTKADEYDLNITLFATPAEGLSGKFTKNDRKEFGVIEGVTNKEYYTNSYHVPVYFHTKASTKIDLEAPFHALCNAGAISYIELDGNARNNQLAFLRIVQYALSKNISYFSVNHPIDRCPVCGYEGIIGHSCPTCGASEEENEIRRLRRVTGYLTGDFQTRFNSAKVAEVKDRVKHL